MIISKMEDEGLDERVRNIKRKRIAAKNEQLLAAIKAKKESIAKDMETADRDDIRISFSGTVYDNAAEKVVVKWLRNLGFRVLETVDDEGDIIPFTWVVFLVDGEKSANSIKDHADHFHDH